jgi:hypothetical protein
VYLHSRTTNAEKRSAAAAAAAVSAAAAALMAMMVAPNFFRHQEQSACIFTSISQPNSALSAATRLGTFHAESAKELWLVTQARAPKRAVMPCVGINCIAFPLKTFPALGTLRR